MFFVVDDIQEEDFHDGKEGAASWRQQSRQLPRRPAAIIFWPNEA
jgi:hypothetical protein